MNVIHNNKIHICKCFSGHFEVKFCNGCKDFISLCSNFSDNRIPFNELVDECILEAITLLIEAC